MKLDTLWLTLFLLSSTPSLAAPQPVNNIQVRDVAAVLDVRKVDASNLWKRKGGGGGGARGGTSSGSSSGSTKGGGGSSSSSSGSSGSSSLGSSSSSRGGSTSAGSGPRRGFGGGRYYGGGATTPYQAGTRSPLGITPVLLGVAALSIFPGLWLFSVYNYPYHHPYTFRNRTASNANSTSNVNSKRQSTEGVEQTKPVMCLCQQYSVCGCDDNGNTTFLDELIGDGTYADLNKTLVTVSDYEGNSTIVINGTLPNGTTSPGGTGDASTAARAVVESAGYWVMIVIVGCTVWLV